MTKWPSSESDDALRLDRRTALKAVGSGVFVTGFAGTGSAGFAKTGATQEGFPPSERTRWGSAASVGNGEARAFLTRRQFRRPRFLGVWLTDDALAGLPEEGEHVRNTIPLPDGASNLTPFEWLTADWNPHGHAPEGVYDVPHFDFHCYFDSSEEVESQIPPGECDNDGDEEAELPVSCDVYERGTKPLPDAQQPPGYVPTDDVEPVMGNHWVEADAPELQGEEFTHTYIYGSFDGRINFLEPMITREFLENVNGKVVSDVKVPRQFPSTGFYPTQYVIRRIEGEGAVAVYFRRFRQFPGAKQ